MWICHGGGGSNIDMTGGEGEANVDMPGVLRGGGGITGLRVPYSHVSN